MSPEMMSQMMGGGAGAGAGGNPLLQNPELMAQMMQVTDDFISVCVSSPSCSFITYTHTHSHTLTHTHTHAQSPMFQQTMQSMASNPQLMEQMMQNNPMFAGNPRTAEMVSPPPS